MEVRQPCSQGLKDGNGRKSIVVGDKWGYIYRRGKPVLPRRVMLSVHLPGLQQPKRGAPKDFQGVLREVVELRTIGTRLVTPAEKRPLASEALTTVVGSVRSSAGLLEVPVAVRGTDTDSRK